MSQVPSCESPSKSPARKHVAGTAPAAVRRRHAGGDQSLRAHAPHRSARLPIYIQVVCIYVPTYHGHSHVTSTVTRTHHKQDGMTYSRRFGGCHPRFLLPHLPHIFLFFVCGHAATLSLPLLTATNIFSKLSQPCSLYLGIISSANTTLVGCCLVVLAVCEVRQR